MLYIDYFGRIVEVCHPQALTPYVYARALLKFSLAKNAKDPDFLLAFHELNFSKVYHHKGH